MKIVRYIDFLGFMTTIVWGMSILLGQVSENDYNYKVFACGVIMMLICQYISYVNDLIMYRKNKKSRH